TIMPAPRFFYRSFPNRTRKVRTSSPSVNHLAGSAQRRNNTFIRTSPQFLTSSSASGSRNLSHRRDSRSSGRIEPRSSSFFVFVPASVSRAIKLRILPVPSSGRSRRSLPLAVKSSDRPRRLQRDLLLRLAILDQQLVSLQTHIVHLSKALRSARIKK